jgi:hypothetical protein
MYINEAADATPDLLDFSPEINLKVYGNLNNSWLQKFSVLLAIFVQRTVVAAAS